MAFARLVRERGGRMVLRLLIFSFARSTFRKSAASAALIRSFRSMFVLQAWAVVPAILSEADAAHLVGICAACKRQEEDPLRILQLGGVSVFLRAPFKVL